MNRLSRELTRAFKLICLLGAASIAEAQELKTGRIGDLALEQGGLIRDCVIGYRTFGKLDASKSNAVLFPTALGWISAGMHCAGRAREAGRQHQVLRHRR